MLKISRKDNEINFYENIDLNSNNKEYCHHTEALFNKKSNLLIKKATSKSKRFIKSNKLISCIQSKKSKLLNTSCSKISNTSGQYYEVSSSQTPSSFTSFRKSKIAKSISKYFKDIFETSSNPNSPKSDELDKLVQLLNPEILTQLNQIINSPNIDAIKFVVPLLANNDKFNELIENITNKTKEKANESFNDSFTITESGDYEPIKPRAFKPVNPKFLNSRLPSYSFKPIQIDDLKVSNELTEEGLQYPVKVADKIKKFNQLIDVKSTIVRKESFRTEMNRNTEITIPKQNFNLNEFKTELNSKFEHKIRNQHKSEAVNIQLPSLNMINSNKSISALNLTQIPDHKLKRSSKTAQSMPLIENKRRDSCLSIEALELKAKDSIELVKNRIRNSIDTDVAVKKEIQFNLLPRVYSLSLINLPTKIEIEKSPVEEKPQVKELQHKIMNTLREVFKVLRDEDNNMPLDIESMTNKQLLDEKHILEQYLFKLDYEYGRNKFMLNNYLFLRLKKRYRLVRVLLDGFKCDKCGRKSLL